MTLRSRAHPNKVYCTAGQTDGLYDAIFPRPPPLAKALVTKADQLEMGALHRKLGHAGKSTMGKVIAVGLGGSIWASDLGNFECAACIKGKGMRLPSQNNNPDIKRASKPLERILDDIWGPCCVPSAGGAV